MKIGLLGKSLKHSFSRAYFTQKFLALGIVATYENCEVPSEEELKAWLNTCPLHGFNVTIPYKVAIMPLLHHISPVASRVGAVNTVIREGNEWWGHNTDVDGVNISLDHLFGINVRPAKAAILGNGGSAMSVKEVLRQRGWDFVIVSRQAKWEDPELGHAAQICYDSLNEHLQDYQLIVNTTPVGTWPNVLEMPPIEAGNIGPNHAVLDLIYNPTTSLLLKTAERQGAKVLNGLPMLHAQAEAAWKVWTGVVNPWEGCPANTPSVVTTA
jgi:shikimate dehydrogenase